MICKQGQAAGYTLLGKEKTECEPQHWIPEWPGLINR